MMPALTGDGVFCKGRPVFLSLEYEGLFNIMQCLCGNGDIFMDRIAKYFFVYFIDLIILFLTAPAGKLYFTRPAEAFVIYFKVAVMTGAIFSSPILFYQFWAFLVPAFTRREKRALSILVPASVGLFMMGIAFSYFFVLPQGLKFFMSFTNDVVQSMWSMESYLDFVVMLVVPFGFIFDFPLLLASAGIVSSLQLRRMRKCIYFLAFVVAAIITPTTDIISQTLLAAPMIVLYEVSIVGIRMVLHK